MARNVNVQSELARRNARTKFARSVMGTEIGYKKRRQADRANTVRLAAEHVKTPDIDKYQAKSEVPKVKPGIFAGRVMKGRRSENVDDQRASTMLSQLPAKMKGRALTEDEEIRRGIVRQIRKERGERMKPPVSKPRK